MFTMKVKSVHVICPDCGAKSGDWCRELNGKVRGGYLLMHPSRLNKMIFKVHPAGSATETWTVDDLINPNNAEEAE